MQSESINELITALVSAQAEFSAVPKGSVNPFFKSKYAALPEVVATAGPVLAKHGLAVSQFITYDETGDLLMTHLLHTSGQYMAYAMKLHMVKADPMAQGSATTFARRYAYMACLGLVADEDDDAVTASPLSTGQAVKPEPKSAPAPASKQDNTLGNAVAKAAGKPTTNMATEKMCKMIWAISHSSLGFDDPTMYDTIDNVTGRKVPKLEQLTFDEAKSVIEHLQSLQNN